MFLFALFVAAMPSAFAAQCSNATLKGAYAFTIHGQIFAGPMVVLVDGIAQTTFDGHGGLKQVDAVSQNGQLPPDQIWRPGTGNYTLDSNCKGTMTIENAGMPPLQLAIVVARNGDIIHTVVTNPNFAITSDAERVRSEE
jgi:hypothetical protein